ncbi:MAG: MFS transporter [Calditrichaeota bacterium]|nr:MFS transporter [Calditrichota bacterium]
MRLVGALGFALSMPYLTIYLHEELGVRLTLIGGMLTLAGIVGSVAAPVGGSLSDRFGRRNLLQAALIGRALTFGFLGWLVWTHKPFHWFSAFYIISSLLGTSIFPLMDAMIADVTDVRRRAGAYSILRVAANLGWAFGPALGGFMLLLGYHSLFWATGLAVLISFAIVRFRVPETVQIQPLNRTASANPFITMFNDKKLLAFLIIFIVLGLVRGQLVATLSVHASGNVGLSKPQIGWLFAINGGMVAFLQVAITKVTDRFHPLRALVGAALLYAAGYALVGVASDWRQMAGAIIVITFGEMVESPTAAAYASSLAKEGMQGAYMGAFNLALHLGWTVGPLLGGFLLDIMPQPMLAWEMLALLAATSGIGFAVMQKAIR